MTGRMVTLIALVVAVAAVGGGSLGLHPPASSDTPVATDQTPVATPPRTASIALADQPAGRRTVVVRSVTLPAGGFVTVNDWYGAVLGHTGYLPPGRHRNVAVPVARPLEPGQAIVAVALRDTARGTAEGNCQYDVVESGSEEDNPYFANDSLVAATAVVEPSNRTAGTAAPTAIAPAPTAATATPCGPTPQG